MKYILTCENGKEIDMSTYLVMQMENKITREEIEERIKFYKDTNLSKKMFKSSGTMTF